MRLTHPPGRAAVLLATAALPLPLHHGAHHGHRRDHHRHPHPTTASPAQHGRRHRHRAFDLPGLVATTKARDARTIRAHAAGDPGDTISDFQFAPATITLHVGDTITWTNQGPSPHSATANNRSFDTGVLTKGQSASHTFTQAGTFTYFCTVHPFMHGTVVVVADHTSSGAPAPAPTSASVSTSTSGSGTSSSAPTASATAAGASSSPGTLPLTGMDSAGAALIGVALVGGGVALRRRIRSQR